MCCKCRRWIEENEECQCDIDLKGKTYPMVSEFKYALNWPPFTGRFPDESIWSLGVSHRVNCGDGEWFNTSPAFFCWVGVGFPYEPVHLREVFMYFSDAKKWLDRFYSKWNSLHGISQ
jgi:hypothetical protein